MTEKQENIVVKKKKKWWKRLLIGFTIFLVLLLGAAYTVFKSPTVQTYLAQKVADYLNKGHKSKIIIGGVDVKLLDNALALKDVLVLDYKSDTLLFVHELTYNVDSFGLEKHYINSNLLRLNDGLMDIKMYKGDSVNTFAFFLSEWQDKKDTTKAPSWTIYSKKLTLDNFDFRFSNENIIATKKGIDYNHLSLQKINGEIDDLRFAGDSIEAKLRNLKLKDKCGFDLHRLNAEVKNTSTQLVLNNLILDYNASLFKGNVKLGYQNFGDFGDFINKVKMNITVAKADVLMDDVGFFAPSLIGWNERVKLQGVISGRVSSIKLQNIFLEMANATSLTGTIEMDGLPEISNTFIYADLHHLSSNYNDLSSITYPANEHFEHIQIPELVKKLGDLSFSGEFTGFINEFVANGNLKTQLGQIYSDVQLKVDKKNGHQLHGQVDIPSFQLGRLISNNLLGNVSMDGATQINFGKNPNASFDGKVYSFDFKNYNYKNIKLNAKVHESYFAGLLSVKDKNLDLDFDGEVNAKKDSIVYNFKAQLNKANLTKLHIIDRDTSLIVSANAVVNLSGNSIDELRGKAILDKVHWKEGLFDEDFGRIQFLTSQGKNGRHVDLSSNIADMSVAGDFSIEHLPELVMNYFKGFANNIITENISVKKNQYVVISARIDDFKQIQRLFFPTIYLERHSEVLFRYSDKIGVLFDMYSDSCSFSGINVKEVALSAHPNTDGKYAVQLNAARLYPNDKIPLNKVDFSSTIKQNTLDFLCVWNNDDSLKNNAHIGANVKLHSVDSLEANFNDTYFYLQNRLWTLNKENQVVWKKDRGEINNLRLNLEEKTLMVQGSVGDRDKDVLQMDFDGISLEFLKLFIHSIDVKGSVTGGVSVASILNKPKVTSSLKLKDLAVNDQPFGETVINTSYLSEEEKVSVNLKVKRVTGGNNDDGYLLRLSGDYFPFKEKDQLNCKIDFKNFRISLLQPYFVGVLSNINKAKVYGELEVKGELSSPIVLGELQFKDFSPTIDYLNVAYDLNDKVHFREDGIYFENFLMKGMAPYYNAVKNEGMGSINGVITHNKFHDFYFNLSINAKKLIALNTDLSRNKNYYGKAFVSGDIMIGGSPQNIIMYANLTTEKFERNISNVDYTVLVLPLDQQEDLPMFDFVEFVNPKDTTTKAAKVKDFVDVPWLDMALDIHVTPDAKVEMIFDSRVGDEITAEGYADMQFQINTNGKFTMNGTYEVEKGEYYFTLKNFLAKKFKVSQGGTVTWTGNPMEAEIDLKALYTVRTKVSSIMDSTKYSAHQIDEMKSTVPVDVVMYLKGNLWKPLTSLDLELLKANVRAQEIVADNIVGESEKAKQAVSLLMQGSFIVPDNSAASGATVINAGLANAKQFLTGQVNNYLSQITGDAINVGFDYNGASDSLSNVSMNVSKNLYNDKVVISGTFDLGKDASDMEVQYKVTKDVTVKAFRKSQQNQKDQEGSVPTQGASVFVRKEFDSLRELFKRKKAE